MEDSNQGLAGAMASIGSGYNTLSPVSPRNSRPYREKEVFVRKVKNGYILDEAGEKHVARTKADLVAILTDLLEIRPDNAQ
jgi:hypothetical protein